MRGAGASSPSVIPTPVSAAESITVHPKKRARKQPRVEKVDLNNIPPSVSPTSGAHGSEPRPMPIPQNRGPSGRKQRKTLIQRKNRSGCQRRVRFVEFAVSHLRAAAASGKKHNFRSPRNEFKPLPILHKQNRFPGQVSEPAQPPRRHTFIKI